MAYIGHPMLVADVVLWPDRSIIKQSYDARERKQDPSLPMHLGFGNLNGDGFGIGWFLPDQEKDPSPCVFTSITPAWNNENLSRLSRKIVSPLIFAHVRAAYPGMPVSEQNCHPFQWGRYLWMHNGVVGGFSQIRRHLLGQLSDAAYNAVQSFHSDSAVSFALFLHHLPDMFAQQTPDVLLQAMQDTLATISQQQAKYGVTCVSLLNFVLSDGATLIATRYVYPETESPASLYYAEGAGFVRSSAPLVPDTEDGTIGCSGGGGGGYSNGTDGTARVSSLSPGPTCPMMTKQAQVTGSSILQESSYRLTQSERGAVVAFVSSEPITGSTTDWVSVPPNMALVITREKSGYLNIMRAPLAPLAPRAADTQEEVARCLEAVSRGLHATARSWQAPPPRSRVNLAPPINGANGLPTGGLSNGLQRALSLELSVMEQEEHRLTGHVGAVLALVVDEEHDMLYTSGVDCTVRVWDLCQCQCVHTITGHRRPVTQLALCGGFLYTTAGGSVRVWSTRTYKCVHVIKTSTYSGAIRSLWVSLGRVFIGSQDTSVKAYDLSGVALRDERPPPAEREPAMAAPAAISDSSAGHVGTVNALALAGPYLVSGGGDAMIRVWRADSLAPVRVLRGHRGSILCLLEVGGLLLSGARDNVVRVWDLDMDMLCRRTLTGHKDDVLHLAALCPTRRHISSSDGGMLPRLSGVNAGGGAALVASASADGTIRVWSSGWTCLRILSAPMTPPHPLQHGSGSGNILDGYSGMANCWASGTGSGAGATSLLSAAVAALSAAAAPPSPGGSAMAGAASGALAAAAMCTAITKRNVVSGYSDGTVRLWAVEDLTATMAFTNTEGTPQVEGLLAGCSTGEGGWGGELAASACGSCHGSVCGNTDVALVHSLRQFVAIRSVSADPRLQDECYRGAKFLARLLEGLGAEVKVTKAFEGQVPVVLGRIGRDPDAPTITFYGHYDVQPAAEQNWRSPPFELTAVDGHLYGRGTSDNKGPILAFLYAVKELMECWSLSGRGMPVNVVFVVEGEEENGSRGFKEVLQQNARWFDGTRLVLISNTLWVGENRPCLTYGMRGMIALSIEVTGPVRDLHSGNDGGVFNEPMTDLLAVLATLTDSNATALVDGFYDGVQDNLMDLAWTAGLEKSSEFDLKEYRDTIGVPALTSAADKRELLWHRWCRPTLSVVDIRCGDGHEHPQACYRFGPTRFSVIPKSAVGKVSVRFVPSQNSSQLVSSLTAHVQRAFTALHSSNSLSVRVENVGEWWEADPHSKLFKMAERAVEREWGVAPLYVREGGTMPVASLTEQLLGAPALMIPMGQSSDNVHLANERIRRTNLIRGKNVVRNLLMEVAGM